MFAVIKTGGKQYVVREGQTLQIEKLGTDKGAVSFDQVLLISDDKLQVGTPIVEGAKVQATILGEGKHDKVVVRKYKSKVRYRRKTGHRQPFTTVKIDKIVA